MKPQTLRMISYFNQDHQQENNPLDANTEIVKIKKKFHDARDLRLQELQDCQIVYKAVKNGTTTKWILLQKLDECSIQIRFEISYLKKFAKIALEKNINKGKQMDLQQLNIFMNKFDLLVEQLDSDVQENKEIEKLLSKKEIEDKQRIINQWKKIIPKDEIILDSYSSSKSEWKQIPLKMIEELLFLIYELKTLLLQESDQLGQDKQDNNKVLHYQHQINDIRKKLSLDLYKKSRKRFEEFYNIIDNFNYPIPKLQEMNQFNAPALEKEKRLKKKLHTQNQLSISTKPSPKKDESSVISVQNEVDDSLKQYQQEKQRVTRLDRGQYKLDIKESQRKVFLAKTNYSQYSKLNSSNDIQLSGIQEHREYIISMIDGQLLKPYTPLSNLSRKDSKSCQNSRQEQRSRKQSMRNVPPLSFADKLNVIVTKAYNNNNEYDEEEKGINNHDYQKLHNSRQLTYFDNRKNQKQHYDEEFIQKVNNNEIKLVKQCHDFYTTRLRFNSKFSQMVDTLNKDRPLTSSLRSQSITKSYQRQDKIQKIRQVAEKARQNFFCRNKEQRAWHAELINQFKPYDSTSQYILEQLQYILEEGLFIQIDDIINMVQQIQNDKEMQVTTKCCQIINEIFSYFGIGVGQLEKHTKFANFQNYIEKL